MIKKVVTEAKFFLWVFPFIFFLLGYVVTHFYCQNASITIPSVIGKNLEQALHELSKYNLSLRLLREKEDALLPEGTIIEQVPAGFGKARHNQQIFVTISRRPGQEKMPALMNQNLQYVAKVCAEQNLLHKKVFLSFNYPENICCAQSLQAGKPLDHERPVVYVCKHTEKICIMPDFNGKPLGDVKKFLHEHDIQVDVFGRALPYVMAENEDVVVIDQKPSSGAIVDLKKLQYVQLQVDVE
jgi:beta-lactam-binding protein with PASTA domain